MTKSILRYMQDNDNNNVKTLSPPVPGSQARKLMSLLFLLCPAFASSRPSPEIVWIVLLRTEPVESSLAQGGPVMRDLTSQFDVV